MVFDSSGNILPCTHFADFPLKEGVVIDKNHFALSGKFDSFWNDEVCEAVKFRESLWQYPADRCRTCEYWGGCIGGCPLLWSAFDPVEIIDQKEN